MCDLQGFVDTTFLDQVGRSKLSASRKENVYMGHVCASKVTEALCVVVGLPDWTGRQRQRVCDSSAREFEGKAMMLRHLLLLLGS